MKIFPATILRQHRTDRKLMGLLREQCAESRKGHLRYCCNQVWTTNGGRILWNATPICETFKISCLMGETPYERRFGMPVNGPVIPFEAMVENHPISAKDQSGLHQFGAKVLPSIFLDHALYAGKETLWSQTLEKWRRWTHQNSTPGGSMQRKC